MPGPRRLSELLAGSEARIDAQRDPVVAGVEYDSRRIQPQHAFFAIPGHVHDGNDFVDQAVDRGAAAIVTERSEGPDGVAIATVPDARRALALAACAWFEHPSHRFPVVGVTGTNGKTSVVSLLRDLLSAGGTVGRWSTTQVNVGDRAFDTPRTTPEAPELQGALAAMIEAGAQAAVVEVSSHALRLERVTGTRFAAATFTNLSPDHLDFHADMDDYLDAKALLFERLDPASPAVVNLDDPAGTALCRRGRGRLVTYGWADRNPDADVRIDAFSSRPGGSRLTLLVADSEIELTSPLFGRANAENIAAAVATALELGVEPATAARVVAEHRGEPGRLERVARGQRFPVLVDFAHTPGALEAALEAARTATDDGRLLLVFGCGGDRDRSKRPAMGRVAAQLADLVIVTSDNPRSEDPQAIMDAIVAGVGADARAEVRVEIDRARAISQAIELAGDGDCVLIAGKGHETEQTFADRTVPFDDRAVAAARIDAIRGAEVSRG